MLLKYNVYILLILMFISFLFHLGCHQHQALQLEPAAATVADGTHMYTKTGQSNYLKVAIHACSFLKILVWLRECSG